MWICNKLLNIIIILLKSVRLKKVNVLIMLILVETFENPCLFLKAEKKLDNLLKANFPEKKFKLQKCSSM